MKVIYLPVTMGSTKMIFQITNKKSSRLSSSSKNSKKLKSKWHLSAIGINSHHKSSNSPSKLKKLGDLKLKPLFERMKQELNALPPIDLEKESSQFNSTDCLRSRWPCTHIWISPTVFFSFKYQEEGVSLELHLQINFEPQLAGRMPADQEATSGL